MTDKVQKIRKEVERLYNQSLADENRQSDRGLERAANVSYGKSKACKELLSFIDSMQEEPVSEDLEKASKEWLRLQLDKSYANYGKTKQMELTHFDGYAMLDAIEFGAKWQKAKDESITEDLGEYINELSKQFPEVSFAKLSRIAVRVAKWQKEQMMKNAISLKVKETFGKGDEVAWVIRPSKILDKKFNVGEKVKVIVIKED